MRQTLHILKKDFHGHWYEIAITLAVTIVFAVSGAMNSAVVIEAAGLLPLTW
jgi:hypothetical protein